MKKLYGTGVALVTPFTESLEVDYKSLKKVLRTHSQRVRLLCSNGHHRRSQQPAMKKKRRKYLAFVKANNPKQPSYCLWYWRQQYRGTYWNRYAIQILPASMLCCQLAHTIINRLRKVLRATLRLWLMRHQFLLILYNVPGRTSSNILAETTLRLAQHQNIIGIKEASGNLEQCMNIMKRKPKDFLLLSGDDMQTVALYAIGAKGVISVLANVFPQIFRKMKEYAFEGMLLKASPGAF